MKSKLLHEVDGLRTFAVVLDKNDEVAGELVGFASRHGVTAAGLSAIGACREATLGYFDPESMSYLDIPVSEQVEVLSFAGDVAAEDGEPALHAHAVLGRRDGSTVGGHVRRGVVWPTLEVVVTETPAHLAKQVDEETGLALINLDAVEPS